jgi:hypothetical protein
MLPHEPGRGAKPNAQTRLNRQQQSAYLGGTDVGGPTYAGATSG